MVERDNYKRGEQVMINRIKSFFSMYAEAHDLLSEDEKKKALAVWNEAEEKIRAICMMGLIRRPLELQPGAEFSKKEGSSDD